jgi:hypothetical protein
VAETRRDEQKLWLILFQIKAVRTRLNLLAIQYWLFVTIAILIAAGTAIFVLAAVLSPIAFLIVAALVSVSALVTLVRVARMAIRKAANPMRAALIADERADLKGRLATVLALAAAPPQSSLWPYLVEDTYGLRGRFEPAQIEPRWLSRAILAPLAAGLAVLALSAALNYYARLASRGLVLPQSDITADIGDLEVLPADPAVKPNARVYADANTLRQLEAKIAEAKKDRGSSWMDKARRLAGNLQDQVTGRNPLPMPSIHLKSSNPSAPNTPPSQVARSTPPGPAADGDGKPAQTNPGAGASGLGNPGNPGPQAPAVSIPGQEADQLAQNGAAAPSQPGANQSGGAGGPSAAVPNAGDGAGGGSSHGAGSDPEHLFGPPEAQQLGSDSFKIAIEAVPSDEASGKGAPAYIPPKVRVPLNLLQFPDAPLARTSVPPGDQMTIKKVFER